MDSGTSAGRPTASQAQFVTVGEAEEDAPDSRASTRREQIVEKPERVSSTTPKSGPPTVDEWQDFFSRFVVKMLVDAYLSVMLGDFIDELTEAEANRIKLTPEDFKTIGSPLAEMANQSSYMKKHGRAVIAFSESSESILTLLFWMRSVNKVAKKHRKNNPRPARTMRARRINNPNQESQNAAQPDGHDYSQVNGSSVPSVGVFNPGGG